MGHLILICSILTGFKKKRMSLKFLTQELYQSAMDVNIGQFAKRLENPGVDIFNLIKFISKY